MLNDAQYNAREMKLAQDRLREIERAPLADRKLGRASYLEAMREPGLVAERIGWILDGSYGYGEMLIAKQILAKPRMNRVAALAHLVAAFDHSCGNTGARNAWHDLSTFEQERLTRECLETIKHWEKHHGE